MALILIVLTACAGGEGTGDSTMDARQELLKRPTYEQAEKQYGAMLMEIRTAIDALNPKITWNTSKLRQLDTNLCDEPLGDLLDARTGIYDVGDATYTVSDELFPRLEKEVTAIAARYGFTQPGMAIREPGKHRLVLGGPWDSTFEMGSALNVTLAVYGACFLPASSVTNSATPTD